jgi:hypothetical protein
MAFNVASVAPASDSPGFRQREQTPEAGGAPKLREVGEDPGAPLAAARPLGGWWHSPASATTRFVPSGALHARRFHDACLVCWKETSRQTADQAVAKMQVGRAMHEAGLVARSGAGGRGPDESGDRVSAAAADANGRRSGLARQTPETCRQSVRCGTYLAGRVLPAPSARVRKSGPSPAGGAV